MYRLAFCIQATLKVLYLLKYNLMFSIHIKQDCTTLSKRVHCNANWLGVVQWRAPEEAWQSHNRARRIWKSCRRGEDNISSHHFRISPRNQGSPSKPDTNLSGLICFILRQLTGWKVFFTCGEWISTKVSGMRSYRSESVCTVSCQRRFSYNPNSRL